MLKEILETHGLASKDRKWQHIKKFKKGYRFKRSLKERFESYVFPEPNSGCFLWEGSINQSGYGNLGDKGKTIGAHRLAWEFAYGPIPANLCVLHKCDNRMCVNPEHLFLGTNAENVADRHGKGRSGAAKGSNNGQSKLTEEIARAIRIDTRRNVEISKAYGIGRTAVSYIKSGKSWRHVC